MSKKFHDLSDLSRISDGSVDAGLVALELMTPRGMERTQEEIAFVCGCSRQMIQKIERRALKKLLRALQQKRIHEF